MKKPSSIFFLLLLALLIRLLLANLFWSQPSFSIQQDNYANFASGLLSRQLNTPAFPHLDTRLFPGYPLFIALFTLIVGHPQLAGIIVSLASSMAAIYLFYYLTRSLPLTFIYAIFPPVWLKQGIKVATEPLTAVLFLLSVYLYLKKRPLISGLVLSYALSVRLIALPLALAIVVFSYSELGYKKLLPRFILGFLLLSPLTPIFNLLTYGELNLNRQFLLNSEYGRSTFGLLMIFQDFFRTLDWHQYRIFASGLFYFLFILFGQISLIKYRYVSPLHRLFNLWSFFSLVFIFSISPTPLIQDLGRYSVVFAPASILGIYESLRRHTGQKRGRRLTPSY